MIIARGCWRESVLRAAADSSHRLAAGSLPFHLDFLTSSLPFAAEPESKNVTFLRMLNSDIYVSSLQGIT